MTEAIVAGAVAGAIAGAIVALAVGLSARRRDGGWVAWTGGRSRMFRSTSRYTRKEFGPGSPPAGAFTRGHGPFDRFNDRAKRVLALAQDEAVRLNHNYIGTEHLLLGLVREGEGVAARALDSLGIELSKVRTAVEFSIGRGDSTTSSSEITLSPRAKRVIELAIDETERLGHSHVGTEHLLLGLVREGEGIASGILESLGVSLERLRHQIIATLGQQAPTTPRAPTAPSTPRAPTSPTGAGAAFGPFDRFDHHAKRILALAQDEAIRFNHNYIGPEHVLLGLVREGEGIAAKALDAFGVELSATRRAVEQLIGRGEGTSPPSEITLTPRMKKVIEHAIDEARMLAHGHVGSEHLLLGLIRDEGSNATTVLTGRGIVLAELRKKVIALLADGGAQGTPPTQ